jgi:ubiquinone/menaquinone biosynthesis C-methylase UbiE
MRLLDCGCGVGSITAGLAEAVASGEVIGIDLQSAQLERARALAAKRGVGNVRFEVGSAYELPFPDASFDAAFAHTLLMHLSDPLKALQQMHRVLKPGGVIGIADDDWGSVLADPPAPVLTRIFPLILKAIEHHGGQPYAARYHRRTLLEAGFSRAIALPTVATAGAFGTAADTRWFAAFFVDKLRQPTFVELVTREQWTDEAALTEMASEIAAWGERPDAYFAAMGVAAVG